MFKQGLHKNAVVHVSDNADPLTTLHRAYQIGFSKSRDEQPACSGRETRINIHIIWPRQA